MSIVFPIILYIIINMKEFSIRLKELRVEKKLSQKQIASELGYAQSTYCDWENGKIEPTASALIAIANYYGVCIDYLLGRQDWY